MKAFIKNIIPAIALFVSATTVVSAQHNDATGFSMPALNTSSPFAGLSGNHVGVRVPNYDSAIAWYTQKLDFRIIHEWPYADEKLAYLAPANDNNFWLEILAEGTLQPVIKYTDLGASLTQPGYHHICLHVNNMDNTLAELKKRGVSTVGEPFYLKDITRKLAFISDPWGNMIELAEVVKQ